MVGIPTGPRPYDKYPRLKAIVDLKLSMTNDLVRCIQYLNVLTDSKQTPKADWDQIYFWGRAYIKFLSSYIEGNVWMHKDMLAHAKFMMDEMSNEQRLFYKEWDWRLDNGKVKITDKKINTKENLRAFLHQSSLLLGISDIDNTNWTILMDFVDVRNGITHPTEPAALMFDLKKIKDFDKARVWFDGFLNDFY